ncbi:MAG: hypothetical protein IPG80_13800 [Anaerolineales bacterium]|uniref:hypothetical protein n=1 Tax=Candidatus Villigracilis vicinus TaxID=3140679 RepID=UPI003135DFE6|nr:hypothetical protein [Anaerolineales bacterium]MBK7450238.1 hypothetical protein [Anaerolineales bacterium]
MKKKHPIVMLITILAIAAFACNLPTTAEVQTDATEEPVNATEAPTELSTGDTVATATATTAPKTVKVSVSTATNCRTGPDVVYQLLMVVQPGSDFDVVGKYSPKGYWIITMPTGGTCWLWGQYAVLVGDASVLPEITPPPAPVAQSSDSNNSSQSGNSNQSNNSNSNDDEEEDVSQPAAPPPAAPTNADITRQCTTLTKPDDLFPSFKMVVQFTWSDASSNETGFNIFKDGAFYTTLPANTQKFSETFTVLLPTSPSVTYGVQAVNANGSSGMVTGTVTYCN